MMAAYVGPIRRCKWRVLWPYKTVTICVTDTPDQLRCWQEMLGLNDNHRIENRADVVPHLLLNARQRRVALGFHAEEASTAEIGRRLRPWSA